MTIKIEFPSDFSEMTRTQQEKHLTVKYKETLIRLREYHYLLGIVRGGRKVELEDLLLCLS